MNILFVDFVADGPYSDVKLRESSMGGTEASVVRVAEGLAERGHNVCVAQRRREQQETSANGVSYTSTATTHFKPTHVVVLRVPGFLPGLRALYPNAKLFVWAHDIISTQMAEDHTHITASKATLICVSKFHVQHTLDRMQSYGYKGGFTTTHIYNPLPDYVKPYSGEIDRNKLLWLSSPKKGLEEALPLFQALLNFQPDFKLHVANPGYIPDFPLEEGRNIKVLGQMPHKELMEEAKNALCLFYPNTSWPETFGLVSAEMNALGVPVVAHRFGATPEILEHPAQTFDCRDGERVINKVMAWYKGDRPRVKLNPAFKLKTVIRNWEGVLDV